MSKLFYLKRNQRHFATKASFNQHLKSIRDTAKSNEGGWVLNHEHVLDLIDFIEDYHDDKDIIQDEFELEHCEFFVAKALDYHTECLWIREKGNPEKRQISTTKYGNPPTAKQNFISYCSYLISEYKKGIRISIAAKEGKDFAEYDLWHIKPTTKVLVEEFICLQGLSDILENVVTQNGQGNNAPKLLPEYDYLQQEFLQFYQNKMAAMS